MSLPKRIFRRFKKIYNSFRNTVYLSVSTKIGTKYTRKPLQLAIFDDQYPSIISQFRVLEYEKYLSKYNAHIFSTNPYFNNLRQQYLKYYPTSESKIHPFKGLAVKADLAYFIFVNNGVDFIGFIEKNKLPFVFTLYPGGGFALHNEGSDKKLRRLFNSQYFRKVIVTQNVTQSYLIEKNLCDASKMVRINGSPYQIDNSTQRQDQNRTNFNVAFCAAKYMEAGLDKGYDLFVESVNLLKKEITNLKAHVVGPFNANDWDVSGLNDVIVFHGSQAIDKLIVLYNQMDIIISPNRASLLDKGAFDGFPTGAVVLAGLQGVAMFVSDELGQNELFEANKDIVIIDHDVQNIVHKIVEFYNNPDLLNNLKNNGKIKLKAILCDENQMSPRYKVLDQYIKQ